MTLQSIETKAAKLHAVCDIDVVFNFIYVSRFYIFIVNILVKSLHKIFLKNFQLIHINSS